MMSTGLLVHRSLCGATIAVALFIAGCSGSPTAPSDREGSFLILNSGADEPIAGGISRHYTADNATIRAIVGQAFGLMTVSINSLDRSEWWTLQFRAPGGDPLLPGTYEPVTAWMHLPTSEAQLTFYGTGRICSPLSGRLVIQTLKYGPLGEIERFRATFEQRCEGSTSGLTGEIFIVDGGGR